MALELFSLIVEEYDPAIEFFVEVLGFELVEDSPSLTNDGRAKYPRAQIPLRIWASGCRSCDVGFRVL